MTHTTLEKKYSRKEEDVVVAVREDKTLFASFCLLFIVFLQEKSLKETQKSQNELTHAISDRQETEKKT